MTERGSHGTRPPLNTDPNVEKYWEENISPGKCTYVSIGTSGTCTPYIIFSAVTPSMHKDMSVPPPTDLNHKDITRR